MSKVRPPEDEFRRKLHLIIFESDTPAGKLFDVVLLAMIGLSIIIVMLESVDIYAKQYKDLFFYSEWVITILFSMEYVMRLLAVRHPTNYMKSSLGVIDVMALLPTYLSLFFPGSQSLGTIRALRLLRVFRIFKLARYHRAFNLLLIALKNARPKLIVFMIGVFTLVIFIGSTMYLIEGHSDSGFSSIPRSMYWAIVTITTVGYGDIAPSSPFGQFMSAILMLVGYAIIAVPTGIVSVEIAKSNKEEKVVDHGTCDKCKTGGHYIEAEFCYKCGEAL